MAKKRITELATETTLKDGQYVAIDHATDGTKKLNLGAELTDLKEDLADETTARETADSKMASEISDLFEMGTPSSYNNDKVPYLFRASGGGKYIGGIEKDVIVGGTVAWNQLIPTNKVHSTSTKNGITATNNNDGTVTLTGTATALTPIDLTQSIFGFQNGHKYYVGSGGANFRIYDGYNVHGYGIMNFGGDTGSAVTLYALVENGATVNAKIPVVAFDLTQLFGSTIADYIYSLEQATAGSGVAKLKEWGYFNEDYYPYDAGSLKSVEGLVSHDMVGLNQWDEELENGYYDSSGVFVASNQYICSKNFIRLVRGNEYYLNFPVAMSISLYDSNKEYIGKVIGTWKDEVFRPAHYGEARYFKFNSAASGALTTYNHDICINLHWSGTRDGEYEPYVKHSYPLDDSLTLRGIPKLDSANQLYYDGDIYKADGSVTRKYGSRAYQSGDESLTDAITDGTNTVYKLSTPTTETADPYQNPQIVDKYGTEEYVTTGIVPVGHDTEYYLDADSVLTPPSTAGTYSLKVTVASDGSKSYSWVSD